jgi:cobalt/nickel transport system permease protein
VTGPAIDTAAWTSRWRARNPGDKALLGLGLTGIALLLPAWPASPLITLVAVGLAVGPAGVNWRVLAAAARGPLAFILLGAAGIALTWRTTGGGWPTLTITADSVTQAARTGAHAVAGTCGVFLLAATTPISDLLDWARRHRVPDVVVDVAGLIYRLLFVLLQVATEVRAAQTARLGYATRRAALRSAGLLTTAVLTRAWDRAHRLEDGLAGRGLDGPLRVLPDPRPSSPRFVAATVLLLTSLTVTALLTPHLPGLGLTAGQ